MWISILDFTLLSWEILDMIHNRCLSQWTPKISGTHFFFVGNSWDFSASTFGIPPIHGYIWFRTSRWQVDMRSLGLGRVQILLRLASFRHINGPELVGTGIRHDKNGQASLNHDASGIQMWDLEISTVELLDGGVIFRRWLYATINFFDCHLSYEKFLYSKGLYYSLQQHLSYVHTSRLQLENMNRGLGLESSDWTLQLWFVNEGSVYRCGIISPFSPLAQYPESLPARPWKVAFPKTKNMVSFFPMVFSEGELINFRGCR